jgi:filamentous hemagglutinin family protein
MFSSSNGNCTGDVSRVSPAPPPGYGSRLSPTPVPASRRLLAGLRTALATAFLCTVAGEAAANPTGMQVIAGQVSTVTSGNQLLITNSPGAILNWQSFSIMPGELTRFIQQSATSSVLNRITGQNPSQILGALQSNGKVFLINPNGIIFGAGSRVDVNGLVASSLDLSDADFLAGDLKFNSSRTTGNVSNAGGITTPSGGQVYLIAPNVTNTGIITSPGGDVMLAAGRSVELADSNDPDIRVVVSAPGDQALNVGKVVAESGRVGVYGALVNQLGLVSANSAVAGENGKIVFKSTDTTLLGAGSETTATGAGTGGEIEVLGNRVGLTGNAVVDASGQTGGGTVLVGGDTHGNNAAIPNAALAYVGPDAQINANAIQTGSGGKVVVWSDQQTQMYGSISARGGAQSGDGGSVETSSANKLDFTGEVDLRAPNGSAGTLLLDPSDIVISSNDSTSDITTSDTVPFTITASNASSNLSISELQNELGLGNVTVTTSSSASAPLGGTITVAAPVAWTNSNSLTLAATQSINISAPITAASGTLVLSAANGNIVQAINSSNPATITVAALSASAPNGSVSLNEPTNAISETVSGVASTAFTLVNSGALTIGTVGSVVGITSGGTVSLSAGGDITQNSGPITAPAVSAVSAGSVELSDPGNAIGTIAGSSGGVSGFSLVDTTGFTVGTVSAAGMPIISGITSTGAMSYAVDLQTASVGDIVVGAPINAIGGTVVLNSAGNVTQGTGGLITANMLDAFASGTTGIGSSSAPLLTNIATLGNVDSQGAVYISNSSDLTVNYINATGAVNVISGGAFSTGTPQSCDCSLMINGASVALTSAGPMTISSGYTITATDAIALNAGYSGGTYAASNNTLTVNGSVSGSTIDLSAGGPIYIGGTLVGTVTQSPNSYTAPPPTLDQCIANPALPGCSSVLPTLAQCTATPTLAGCSVVLPTLAQCTANSSLAGCSAVLPTLAQCTVNSSLAGCSAVLPTLAQCTTNSSLAGCSAVLPTLAQCTANSTLAGCSAVLPTLAACTANSSLPGCSAVLPTLTACTANSSLAGCSAVLPTLAACTANTSLAGCSAVLPTLTACTTNSSLAGCSAVLPTLAACTANSSLAGCSAVLPTLTACTTNSSLAGCSAVLPTVTACTTNPSLAGCTAVLPTLAQCTADSSLAGCSVVPTVTQCALTPDLAGCASSTTTTPQQAAASAPVQQAVSQTVAQVTTATYPTPAPDIVPTGPSIPALDLPPIVVTLLDTSTGEVTTSSIGQSLTNTTGNGTTTPGVPNDTNTKMYCN